MIRCLSHTEIDKGKWDMCLEGSVYETIFPYSWYLDVVSPGWYALIRDDYRMVMPLTWKRKYGLRMLMQPLLCQQLGIFSPERVTPEEVSDFLGSISPKYLLVDICLNCGNLYEDRFMSQEPRHNFELDISDPDGDPGEAYTTNTSRNLKKGQAFDQGVERITTDTYLDLKFSLAENAPLKRYRNYFYRLYSRLEAGGRAELVGMKSGNGLHTAAVFGYSGTRVIYLNGCSTLEGKEKRGMFVLMDRMIRSWQGRKSRFDFEGSGIPGVARFFQGFGARRMVYQRVSRTPLQLFRVNK